MRLLRLKRTVLLEQGPLIDIGGTGGIPTSSHAPIRRPCRSCQGRDHHTETTNAKVESEEASVSPGGEVTSMMTQSTPSTADTQAHREGLLGVLATAQTVS